jgi:hypothetical protein
MMARLSSTPWTFAIDPMERVGASEWLAAPCRVRIA